MKKFIHKTIHLEDLNTKTIDKKRFYEMQKMDQDRVVAGRSISEILKRFDKKIKDPRSFSDGKQIVKIIKSLIVIKTPFYVQIIHLINIGR